MRSSLRGGQVDRRARARVGHLRPVWAQPGTSTGSRGRPGSESDVPSGNPRWTQSAGFGVHGWYAPVRRHACVSRAVAVSALALDECHFEAVRRPGRRGGRFPCAGRVVHGGALHGDQRGALATSSWLPGTRWPSRPHPLRGQPEVDAAAAQDRVEPFRSTASLRPWKRCRQRTQFSIRASGFAAHFPQPGEVVDLGSGRQLSMARVASSASMWREAEHLGGGLPAVVGEVVVEAGEFQGRRTWLQTTWVPTPRLRTSSPARTSSSMALRMVGRERLSWPRGRSRCPAWFPGAARRCGSRPRCPGPPGGRAGTGEVLSTVRRSGPDMVDLQGVEPSGRDRRLPSIVKARCEYVHTFY